MDRTQDFMEKSTKSAKIFADIKNVLEMYFSGEIYSTEDHEGQFDTILDCKCGIDALVDTDEAVFGIAHRVKYNNYTDFTIRVYNKNGRRTEIDHMRQSGFKPRYHVQTVCIDGKPTMIAIAKSADLRYAIDTLGIAKIKTTYDGNQFAILDWNILISNGIDVDIINL